MKFEILLKKIILKILNFIVERETARDIHELVSNPNPSLKRKVLLFIGPESSATRSITDAFLVNREVYGNSNAAFHEDPLDLVWLSIKNGDLDKGKRHLETFFSVSNTLVSRRSIPAGVVAGVSAKFCDPVDIDHFLSLCQESSAQVSVFFLSRNPYTTLLSQTENRGSVQGEYQASYFQYQVLVKETLKHCLDSRSELFLASLEGFVLDKNFFLESLHRLVGLTYDKSQCSSKSFNPNEKYYNKF